MDMVVDVVVDMAKAIEEEVVSIHQTMKEQTKTYIPQEGVEDDITQGKMKGEGMINPKFSIIIVTNMVIMHVNVEIPLTIWKDQLTILKRKIKKNLICFWPINEKVKKKTHDILTSKQTIIFVISKTCLWSLMNRKWLCYF